MDLIEAARVKAARFMALELVGDAREGANDLVMDNMLRERISEWKRIDDSLDRLMARVADPLFAAGHQSPPRTP